MAFGFYQDPLYTPEYQVLGDEVAVLDTSKGVVRVSLAGAGAPIPVAELQRYGGLRDQAEFVRKKAYFLENMLLPAENNG